MFITISHQWMRVGTRILVANGHWVHIDILHQVRPTCFDGVWWFISLSKEASTMLNASWQWNQELYGT